MLSILIAEKNGTNKDPIIFGYKFDESTVKVLRERHIAGAYKYGFSKNQKSLFKIRLYSIVLFRIVQHIQEKHKNLFDKGVYLTLCRDFDGNENNIRSNLTHFLTDILKLEIKSLKFDRLDINSNADRYAYLMRNDKKNLMKQYYVQITKEDFEKLLRK